MSSPTLSLQWHITTACEQRCEGCYIFNSPEGREEIRGQRRIKYREMTRIVDDFVATCQRLNATPRISMTGGNPLLHPRIWQILTYCQERSVKVHLMGNPFGITNEVAQQIKEAGVDRFQLSLDGMQVIHDRLRMSGSFIATSEACGILQRNGVGVGIMSTVSKKNAGEFPALIDHVVGLGARAFAFARYCPTHRDVDAQFTPQEYRTFLATVWAAFKRHVDSGTNLVLKDHLWTLFLKEEGLFVPEPTNGVIVDGCGIGISHMTILADGTVYACRRFPSPVGRVPDQSLFDIFVGNRLDSYRQVDRLEKCRTCDLLAHCRGCMAVTYGTTGSWTAPDPQCWK